MGGIFQSDIFIKAAIELGIEDLRKNPYLIDHMFQSLRTNRYVREQYGQKQIDACKEWLANNQIDIYMKPRDDRDRLPNISIYLGTSNEKEEMKHMGDLSTQSTILLPNKIGKPIPFMVPPFIPEGYNQATGVLSTPTSVDLSIINPGMILANPATNYGYKILGVTGTGIQLEAGLAIDGSSFAILPHYQYYKARIEHTFNEETYIISCNCHGDPQNTIFLWSIAKYSILRYRQDLLEGNGMAESKVNSSGLDANELWTTPGGEKAYSRLLTITAQTEDSWIKAPARIIEAVSLSPKKTCKGIEGGITIISNTDTPPFINPMDETWTAIGEDQETPSEDEPTFEEDDE
jgi:hypothetical protein